jgi:hypothetical protein
MHSGALSEKASAPPEMEAADWSDQLPSLSPPYLAQRKSHRKNANEDVRIVQRSYEYPDIVKE